MNRSVIALVGRPNVGKSTLFNKVVGKRIAIVEDSPGVTRDRQYASVSWLNRVFLLIDTGGFEPASPDRMFLQMKEQCQIAIEEAQAIVFLVDGRAGLTQADREIIDILRRSEKPLFVGVNKIDTLQHFERMYDFFELGVEQLFPLSAEHGLGINELFDQVIQVLPEHEGEEAISDSVRIALIGRPNVGKSSLVNRLLGESRMIVDEAPGTTRDAIDTLLSVGGRHYTLIDTAGIRRRSHVSQRLEKYSAIMALKSIERCDIALVLFDASEGVTDQDARIASYTYEAGRGLVIILNKWDLLQKEKSTYETAVEQVREKLKSLSYAPILSLSALTGQRVRRIFPLIDQVWGDYTKRISTSDLNRALEESVKKYSPPSRRGKIVKFYYATQISTKPPTFVCFVNHPEEVHFSYMRYFQNQLREKFGFSGTPLRVFLRKKR